MKSACLIFKKNNNVLDNKSFFSIIETFCLHGYDFNEIRILSLANKTQINKTLQDLSSVENLLLVSEKTELPAVKRYVETNFPQGIYQGGINGAGIYQSKNITWFVVSADNSETGMSFAQQTCIAHLEQKYGKKYGRYVIRCIGANEAYVQRLLTDATRLAGDKIFYRYANKYAEMIIELFYEQTIPKILLDDITRMFADGLGESIYALEDVSIEEQLVRLLKLRNKKLSVAESFTGGGVGSRIVSVSGASQVYFEGLNTYDENSKIKRLNVSQFTLKSKGAVSDQTAYEMAAGLIGTGDCDIAIATTGLAGPKTDRSLLPVGLCYISVGTKEKVFVYRYQFDGSREEITQTAINYALFLAYKLLRDI